jgi:uncharacterized delta-60 repeat protein
MILSKFRVPSSAPAQSSSRRHARSAVAKAVEQLEPRRLFAGIGALDTTFGSAGRTITDFSDFALSNDAPLEAIRQSDGKTLVLGGDGTSTLLARYNANGSLDTSFGLGGKLSTGLVNPTSFALDSAGGIYIGGNLGTDARIVKLTSGGDLDADNFGSRGVLTITRPTTLTAQQITPSDIEIDSTGRLLVAFNSPTFGGIARFDSSGNLDVNFGNDSATGGAPNTRGYFVSALVNATLNDIGLAPGGNGAVVAVGTQLNANNDVLLLKLNTQGVLDTTFGAAGVVVEDFGGNDQFLTLAFSGTQILAGGFFVNATQDDMLVARYASNGARDNSFNGNGRQTIDFTTTSASRELVAALSVLPSGRIVATGLTITNNSTVFSLGIAALTPAGAIDTAFGPGGSGRITEKFFGFTNAAGAAAVVEADGSVTTVSSVGNVSNFGLYRVTADGQPAPGFGTRSKVITDFSDFTIAGDAGNGVVRQSDGKYIAVGQSSLGGGLSLASLARFNVDGTLDTTFGNNGRVIISAAFSATSAVIRPDGRILVTCASNNGVNLIVASLNPDGSADTNFGAGGSGLVNVPVAGAAGVTANEIVYDQANSRIIVAGLAGRTDFDAFVTRLDDTGGFDTTFGTAGTTFIDATANDAANAVTLDSAGRILFTGNAGTQAMTGRLTTAGILDNTFGTGGLVRDTAVAGQTSTAADIAVSGTRIIVAGSTSTGVISDFAVFAYSASNGARDLSFDTDGVKVDDLTTFGTSFDTSRTLFVRGDGSILVGGIASDSSRQFGVALQLTSTGARDGTFGGGAGFTRLSPLAFSFTDIFGLAANPDGSVVAVGLTGDNTSFNFYAARLSAAGVIDTTFGSRGVAGVGFSDLTSPTDTGRAQAVATLPDGSFVVVGGIDSDAVVGSTGSAVVAKYLASGALDTTFGVGGRLAIEALATASDVDVVTTGGVTQLLITGTTFGNGDATGDMAVVRVGLDGSIDTNFGSANGVASVSAANSQIAFALAVDSQGRLVLAGSDNTTMAVLRLNADGTPDSTFGAGTYVQVSGLGTNSRALDLAILSNDRILLGGFANPNVDRDFALVRLTSQGQLDNTFGTSGGVVTDFDPVTNNTNDTIQSLAIDAQGRIVAVGRATLADGKAVFGVARYTSNGGLDLSFNTTGRTTVDFTTLSTDPSTDIARTVSLMPDGRIVVSGSSSRAAQGFQASVRLTSTGTLDTTFNPATGGRVLTNLSPFANSSITDTLIAPDGSLLAVGSTAGTAGDFALTKVVLSPSVSITSATVNKPLTGTLVASLTVTLSSAIATQLSIPFTLSASNPQGALFTPAGGNIVFAPGATTTTIPVTITGDSVQRPQQIVTVNLTPTSGVILPAVAPTLTINDPTVVPTVSVSGGTVAESANGSFTVSLSASFGQNVTVNFATSSGSATSDVDFTNTAGTLTFLAGETQKTVIVPVINDARVESTESFTLTLSAPTNANLGTAAATVNITDNDVLPVISLPDSVAAEASGKLTLPFTLSAAYPDPVTFNLALNNGTAVAGTHFTTPASNLVTFAPGETSKSIDVTLTDDARVNADRTFTASLSNPVNATLARTSATLTITNDDTFPVISVPDVSASESSGTLTLPFTLSAAYPDPVTVNFILGSGAGANAAIAGTHFAALSGTVTFAAGETAKTVDVTLIDDLRVNANRVFFLGVNTPVNATLARSSATLTITNDDVLPSVSISDTTVAESLTGSVATLTVTLSATYPDPVSVNFATANGTAAAGLDFTGVNGTLTFAPNETTKTITVPVLGDLLSESDENFTVNLTAGSNAGTLTKPAGAVTITNLGVRSIPLVLGKAVTYNDASGQRVSVTLSKPKNSISTGQIVFLSSDPAAAANPLTILVNNTLTNSNLTISASRATIIRGLSIDGPIGTLSASRVTLIGTASVNGAATSINFGSITGSTLRVAGNATTVSLGAANNAKVFVGVRPDLDTLPTARTDFSNQTALLRTLTLRSSTFSDLIVAAPVIRTATLGRFGGALNPNAAFGVVTTNIASNISVRRADNKSFSTKAVIVPGLVFNEANFTIRVLP